ncbi:MAG: guanylate kinase [Flavobacteriales bacterium]|nr:guanylate kinase [Flavobacteriales bacterium]|tara:strand:- start:1158 stop:1733 length:576 start_codon:yes stop_codon:yes gene_type:complete
MLYPNKIIIISGSSGSGKTTLVNYLMLHAAFNLTFSVSACSRQKRPLETHGKNYFFLSVEEFKEKIHNNQFLEWEEVYKDHFYGTLKSSTMDILNSGKNILFDVDVKGAQSIKDYFQDQALSIFIKAPTVSTARDRLTQRGTESKNQINFRINKIQSEIIIGQQMDYQLINDDLSESQAEISSVVKNFLDV